LEYPTLEVSLVHQERKENIRSEAALKRPHFAYKDRETYEKLSSKNLSRRLFCRF